MLKIIILTLLFLLIYLVNNSHAYVDPGTFGTISQIIFLLVNSILLFFIGIFKPIKNFLRKFIKKKKNVREIPH